MYTIKINGSIVDLDGDSAIGVTRRGFNFSEPDTLGLSSSNTFTLPATSHNSKILGFPANVDMYTYNSTGMAYSEFSAEVYIDGILVLSGKAYLTDYNGRYSIKVVDGRNIFDAINEIPLSGGDSLTTLLASKINEEVDSGDYDDYITYGANANGMLFIPYSAGGLYESWPYLLVNDDNVEEVVNYIDSIGTVSENYNHMCTEFIGGQTVGNYKGGHFFVKVTDVIDTIMDEVGATVTFPSITSFIRIPDLILYKDLISGDYYMTEGTSYKYSMESNDEECKLTALDILKVIMQEYCLVLDVTYNSITQKYNCKFTQFNDVPSNEYNLNDIEKPSLVTYTLENYCNRQWIAYSSLGNDEDATITGGKLIEVENESLEKGNDETVLFSINRHLGGYLIRVDGNTQTETVQFNLIDSDTYDKIIIVDKGVQAPYTVTVHRIMANIVDASVNVNLYTAVQATVGTTNFWDSFENYVEKPVSITVKCGMNPVIFNNIRQDCLVTFKNMPGKWYVQEVSGYNPNVGNDATIKAILYREN